MTDLGGALIAVVLGANALAMFLALRVFRQGRALILWVEEEFPDALADAPERLRRRAPFALVNWIESNIAFPDDEFGRRRSAYLGARKRSNLALAASIGLLVLFTVTNRQA